jgi:hypothetical protein
VRYRIVVGALLLTALGLIAWAGQLRGAPTEPALRDAAVEAFEPPDGSPAAVRQSRIGIDLAAGWTGVLQINGIEIPEDQLARNEPLNQVYFTPGEGKEIESLAPGPVVVAALIWRSGLGETRDDARAVQWRFNVA